ncbi:YiiX/YebB-like N1pC/P60 family cysteine hydrolase [Bdellovibrio sp. HCB274]|uniref:YiiX/YebB-like N1pC/P60 family cysteine hydrolase n=1 Tax=Bdellovibrio sp. HCB274 TaxID=3394361 RepID=UPI0039B4F7DA
MITLIFAFFSTIAFASPVLMTGLEQVNKDLNNPQVFNAQTCPEYINKVTDFLFAQPANHFIPQSPEDIQSFKEQGIEMVQGVFMVRAKLNHLLQKFSSEKSLTDACILKMREGMQYARFTEEYLIDWLVQNKVVTFKESPILAGESPFLLRNTKFAAVNIQPGDVLLIRGKSYVSAMIARIGDEEGNFSHMAIVAENDKGELFIVESLIQYGVVTTPLEKWRQTPDASVALYRQNDISLAHKAAHYAYTWSQKPAEYDFEMDDAKYDKVFCAEVVKLAYDKASDGKVILPAYRSHVSKFKGGAYPKSLGVMSDSLFAPYDIEVDPRFDLVAEWKYFPLLRQVRMQDSVFQSIYAWMPALNYKFYSNWWITTQAYVGKGIRYLGFMSDEFPTYMPIQTMESVLQFETVSKALEANLEEKESQYYTAHGYLPSFMDMMRINDEYRRADCQLFQDGKSSQFHDIFRGDSCNQ